MSTVQKYSAEHKTGVLALLALHWKRSPAEAQALFEWRYECNPCTDSPCVFVAMDGDAVVGLRCFVVQNFSRGGGTWAIACAADAIVHPEHRRQGILRELTRLSLQHLAAADVPIVLNLSSNSRSAAAARSLEWQAFGSGRYLYCVMPSVAAGRAGTDRYGERRRSPDFQVSASVTSPPDCHHPLAGTHRFARVRDPAYYRWRYRQPFATFHQVETRDDAVNGYVILQRTGRFMYSILEYGYDEPRVLRAALAAFARRRGPCVLRLRDLAMPQDEAALFRSAGFFAEPRLLVRALRKHRVGALVRAVGDSGGNALDAVDLVDEANWQLLPADVH